MKRTLGVLIALIVIPLTLNGCSVDDESLELVNKQVLANRVINDIKYIKDPRTNLCYAYYWGGGTYGGPTMTLVPEASIPPELLTIGEVPK